MAGTCNYKDEDDDSSFGDSDSEDSEGDELLDNDQLGMKIIHKKIAKAQAKIAELVTVLEKARSKRAKEDAQEEEDVYKNNGLDADSDIFPMFGWRHDISSA